MYAIVEIAGKQYKVQKNDKLVVPRLGTAVDDSVTFDRVLLVSDGDDVQLGTPVVESATVTAKVVEHFKGDKVLVFRKKRRKRFKVKRGHRQPYTRIEVSELSVNGKDESKKKSEAASKSEASEPKAKVSTEDKSKSSEKSASTGKAKSTTKDSGKAKAKSTTTKSGKAKAKSSTKETGKAKAKSSTKETGKAKSKSSTKKSGKAKAKPSTKKSSKSESKSSEDKKSKS